MADTQEWAKKYPLHNAVKYLNVEKLTILLAEKLDINEKNDEGYPLLVLACEQERKDSILRLLIDRADIDPILTNNKGFNALHSLAFRGNMYWIIKLLERFPGIPIDAVTNKKDTALTLAAKRNHDEVIQYLHDKGANINHQNAKKYSALHFAANNGYVESTQKLLELGASVNLQDNFQLTPLMKSVSWGFSETSIILLKHGAGTESVDHFNRTALIHAIRNNRADIVKLLLGEKANPNHVIGRRGDHCQTALVAACWKGNVHIIKLLIKHEVDIHYPSKDWPSALFACAVYGNPECMEELLKAGINAHAKLPNGITAIDIAKKHGQFDIVHVMKKYMPTEN